MARGEGVGGASWPHGTITPIGIVGVAMADDGRCTILPVQLHIVNINSRMGPLTWGFEAIYIFLVPSVKKSFVPRNPQSPQKSPKVRHPWIPRHPWTPSPGNRKFRQPFTQPRHLPGTAFGGFEIPFAQPLTLLFMTRRRDQSPTGLTPD
jgi:hypothetical protein